MYVSGCRKYIQSKVTESSWLQAIQDSLLPPSVHIRKRVKASKKLNTNGNGAIQQNDSNNNSSLTQDRSSVENQTTDDGHVKSSVEFISEVKTGSVASSSPYPNVCYPQLTHIVSLHVLTVHDFGMICLSPYLSGWLKCTIGAGSIS